LSRLKHQQHVRPLKWHEAEAGVGAVESLAGLNTAQHSAPRTKPVLKIPVIDLTTDLDLSKNQAVLDWWQKEKEAFQTATTYDEEAEIQVSQVAVCPFRPMLVTV
jgi:hypothetical protein